MREGCYYYSISFDVAGMSSSKIIIHISFCDRIKLVKSFSIAVHMILVIVSFIICYKSSSSDKPPVWNLDSAREITSIGMKKVRILNLHLV